VGVASKTIPFAKFEVIQEQFELQDEQLYFYALNTDETLRLRRVSEYELLAEEGLSTI
jgi:hypothetical protein